jgi:urease accessory protein
MSEWEGVLNLTYQKIGSKTKIISAYSKAPLKIQSPFYPEGEEICHSVSLHTAGGIVGGDRLLQNIHLFPDSQSLITTAAAAKIYRSNGKSAQQEINIKLENNACIEFLPQENIVFNGAIFQQNLQVELEENTTFLGWEITRFGRTARKEIFGQGDWKSKTEIWQDGQPLWIDRQWLPGNKQVFYSNNGLAGQPVVGTLTYIGLKVTPELLTAIRQLWQNGDNRGEAGVTQLIQGLICRYRGDSTAEVKNWFLDVWGLLRSQYLGRGAIKSRIWQI